jgi:hypothetical protein
LRSDLNTAAFELLIFSLFLVPFAWFELHPMGEITIAATFCTAMAGALALRIRNSKPRATDPAYYRLRRIAGDLTFGLGLAILAMGTESSSWKTVAVFCLLVSLLLTAALAKQAIVTAPRTPRSDRAWAVMAVVLWVSGGVAGWYGWIWPYYALFVGACAALMGVLYHSGFLTRDNGGGLPPIS